HHEDEHDGHAHHDHGEFDPHVWMDPTLVARWADEIAEVLAEIDPAHEAEYAARAAELAAEMDKLDEWIMDQVEVVPRHRRVIVTDHDVLGYFAQRYGFELLDSVVPGFSTVAEPSARHLAELRELLAEHAVPAIFVGTTVNPQVAESIADDLGIVVVPIYTGSLSEGGGAADTYDRFMRTNVARIVAALGS
ncbi:MAG: metal ABC transporter substrate-binding protein, partial [Spirochaetaceae bacterium]|nr:metal ABC transporter substrate-binding protein [Spirochaetaceae bacterium]